MGAVGVADEGEFLVGPLLGVVVFGPEVGVLGLVFEFVAVVHSLYSQ